VLDLASWIIRTPEPHLVRAAFFTLAAGLVTGVLAAIVGMVDYIDIRGDHRANKTATTHLVLNLLAIGLYALSAGLRFGSLADSQTGAPALWVSVVALAVLSYSGYLGGRLVYSDGVAVGRHRRAMPLPPSTIVAGPKTADGRMAVAPDSSLPEGGTLRVNVDGTILTIARVAGGLHAFQEFCTHRYGPLSEGNIVGCHIVCPWHRSRFDVRNGRVTEGPARLDLRMFQVESRDGQIWLSG
jgi:nitrite reductase/ring-hydroxylating ferredoxin subunit/uncharacterized membrane protein